MMRPGLCLRRLPLNYRGGLDRRKLVHHPISPVDSGLPVTHLISRGRSEIFERNSLLFGMSGKPIR